MGTPGSAGGAGGDSAGGPTYAIYRGDGAQITQQQVQLAHGSGGASMGEGPKGAAAEVGE
jgi:hypothetical protein